MQALKFLRHLQRSSYRDASRATISATIYNEMEILMQYYLTHTLERGLNSPAFLRRVRQEQPKNQIKD
jgi:DNA repair protein RecO (recombination protein O)